MDRKILLFCSFSTKLSYVGTQKELSQTVFFGTLRFMLSKKEEMIHKSVVLIDHVKLALTAMIDLHHCQGLKQVNRLLIV